MKSKPESGDLRERALRLLARREHSRAELVRKLAQAGFTLRDIDVLLDEFEEKNWLSDRRFAESYVADHRAKTGSIKLAYDLRQRGVSETVIGKVLSENCDSELERAQEVWQKKFGTAPADAAEKAKQMRFLLNRGFSLEVIRQTLTHID
ncbi:MAG: recombination regulator RecX [Thiobacillus sp.]|uniref:recombination regulator RecX n=1 Tax=Thiobacillus sp. TaxID=924 RepID=UPI00168C68E6|nr:recombination regulator RecX [Thiobacillus sp.]QLQ03905.1 MAG: recombination regulator RecX [Thiobacillus sp.]